MPFASDLNVLDWIVVLVVVSSVISSILKGFARETISLGAVIAGLLLASWFYPQAGSLVLAYVKTQGHRLCSGLYFDFHRGLAGRSGCFLRRDQVYPDR